MKKEIYKGPFIPTLNLKSRVKQLLVSSPGMRTSVEGKIYVYAHNVKKAQQFYNLEGIYRLLKMYTGVTQINMRVWKTMLKLIYQLFLKMNKDSQEGWRFY
jgi:hypothetical protein